MTLCPVCGHKNEAEKSICEKCGADLQLFQKIYFAPDMLYNSAVALFNRKEYLSALEFLSAAAKLRPKDEGILGAMIAVYIQLRYFTLALEKCYEIMEFCSDENYAKLALELAQELKVESDTKRKLREFFAKPLTETIKHANWQTNDDFIAKPFAQLMQELTGFEWREDAFALNVHTQVKQPEQTDKIDLQSRDNNGIDSSQGSVNEGSNSQGKSHKPQVIATVAAVLVMLIGFSLLYWRISANIKYQTDVWAKSTEGQIISITHNLALQVDQIKAEQAAQRTDSQKNSAEIQGQLQSTKDELAKLESRLADITALTQKTGTDQNTIKNNLQTIQASLELINKKIE